MVSRISSQNLATSLLLYHPRKWCPSRLSNISFVSCEKRLRTHSKPTWQASMASKSLKYIETTQLISLSPHRCSPNKYKMGHAKDRPNPDSDYFPPSSSKSSFSEQIIRLIDPLNLHWPCIVYFYFDLEKVVILTCNWVQYACLFSLQLMDIVRFNPCFGNNHFMTQHLHWPGFEPVQIRLPAFPPHNRPFEVEFRQSDLQLGVGRLVIHAELEDFYFRGIIKEFKQGMLKLTDYKDKDWFVKMVYSGIGDLYILMDDWWHGFVGEHELEVRDRVWFYKLNIHCHDKYFLDGSDSDSFGSDPEDEENQSLLFELEIIENNCLIIPIWMIYEDFPLQILDPNLKETLQLPDYLGHKWEVSLSYESALDSYVITDSWSLYIQHYHLKYMDLIRCYRYVPQRNSNHFLILDRISIGKCLFKKVVPKSNRLRIFINQVKGSVNPAQVLVPYEHLHHEYIIHVTDYLDQTWEMKLVPFLEGGAYVVVQGWKYYVAKHGLRHKDRISYRGKVKLKK